MSWIIGGRKSLVVVLTKVNREICNPIVDQLAVFNSILSVGFVYIANINSSATSKGDLLHPAGANFDPAGINLDVVNISDKLQFMMENGRKSASGIYCSHKVWIEVDYRLVPDLVPFFLCKMEG